jgi:hypothetical protein
MNDAPDEPTETPHRPDDAPLWMQFAAAIASGQTASDGDKELFICVYVENNPEKIIYGSSDDPTQRRASFADFCASRADAMLTEYRKRFPRTTKADRYRDFPARAVPAPFVE